MPGSALQSMEAHSIELDSQDKLNFASPSPLRFESRNAKRATEITYESLLNDLNKPIGQQDEMP